MPFSIRPGRKAYKSVDSDTWHWVRTEAAGGASDTVKKVDDEPGPLNSVERGLSLFVWVFCIPVTTILLALEAIFIFFGLNWAFAYQSFTMYPLCLALGLEVNALRNRSSLLKKAALFAEALAIVMSWVEFANWMRRSTDRPDYSGDGSATSTVPLWYNSPRDMVVTLGQATQKETLADLNLVMLFFVMAVSHALFVVGAGIMISQPKDDVKDDTGVIVKKGTNTTTWGSYEAFKGGALRTNTVYTMFVASGILIFLNVAASICGIIWATDAAYDISQFRNPHGVLSLAAALIFFVGVPSPPPTEAPDSEVKKLRDPLYASRYNAFMRYVRPAAGGVSRYPRMEAAFALGNFVQWIPIVFILALGIIISIASLSVYLTSLGNNQVPICTSNTTYWEGLGAGTVSYVPALLVHNTPPIFAFTFANIGSDDIGALRSPACAHLIFDSINVFFGIVIVVSFYKFTSSVMTARKVVSDWISYGNETKLQALRNEQLKYDDPGVEKYVKWSNGFTRGYGPAKTSYTSSLGTLLSSATSREAKANMISELLKEGKWTWEEGGKETSGA